ncbi:MAG: hypothetical protein EOO21_05090, partial [Comamonadaceae bacterium]
MSYEPGDLMIKVSGTTATFTQTRARSTDSDTSKVAALNAVSRKACGERIDIHIALSLKGPMTAREIAAQTG